MKDVYKYVSVSSSHKAPKNSKRMDKQIVICSVKNFSTRKRNKIVIHTPIWMNLKNTEWQKGQAQECIHYEFIYLRHINKQNWNVVLIAEVAGFPGGTSGKNSTCQRRRHKRHRFDPWVGKISWRRTQQPTPVFLPGKSHGQRIPAGYSPKGRKGSDTTKETGRAHTHTFFFKSCSHIGHYRYSSLCCTVGPCWLSILYIVMCMC